MCTRRLRNKYIIQNFPFKNVTFTLNRCFLLNLSGLMKKKIKIISLLFLKGTSKHFFSDN